MNIRNTKSATRSGTLNVNNKTYALARSDVFYYLQFIDYNKEIFKTASNLSSKPTIVFYTENATNKVIYDYSLANTTDKAYLSSFFANLNSGDQFGLTRGSYLDKSELSADLSSTATFNGFNDYKVFGTVVSVDEQNSALDVYDGNYFIETPQLTKTGDLGTSPATVNYALISVASTTNKPLSYLSPKPGDLISVVNPDSGNNGIKFEITEITTLNNKEVFKLKTVFNNDLPETESLIGAPSIIDLYVETGADLEDSSSLDKIDVGCCKNLVTNQYHENSTKYQCGLRTNNIFSFTIGVCNPASSLNVNVPTTVTVNNLQFDASVFPYVLVGNVVELQVKIVNNNFVVEGQNIEQINANTVALNTGTIYRFVQSDSSNTGYPLRFSSSPQTVLNTAVPYVNGVYGIILPEGMGSDIYLDLKKNQVPARLYMYTENDITISSQILYINP